MAIGLLMFALLFLLLLTGMPIAGALGAVGLGTLIILNPNEIKGTAYVVWTTWTSFELAAAPLFILMGEIMLRSGVSNRFYNAVSPWLRRLPGGLLQTNVAACSIFAAISGSSVATAATIGRVAIPAMISRNTT